MVAGGGRVQVGGGVRTAEGLFLQADACTALAIERIINSRMNHKLWHRVSARHLPSFPFDEGFGKGRPVLQDVISDSVD